MKVSPHFAREEFACHCGCGFAAVDVGLLTVLESLRDHFNAPVAVVSGCRCEAHNQSQGGAPQSYHVKGMAADIKVQGIDPAAVADWLEAQFPHTCGIGRYPTWTHIDVRPTKARWQQ